MNTEILAPTNERGRSSLLDRALVAAFLENIPDDVYFKDRQSRFVAVSNSTAVRHGLKPVAMLGRTDFDHFGESHAREAFEDEQRIIATGQPLLGKLERETWPDGRVTWALTSKMPLRDGDGVTIGTFGLTKDVTASKQMELDLEKAHRDLVDASRMAGMAEVATGVLHNVGNVLNSLNVSATMIATRLRQSKADSLVKIALMLREHSGDLAQFLTEDPKGRRLPELLEALARQAVEERTALLQEIESLQKNTDHIREIVVMQQDYATVVGVVDELNPVAMMEDALRMNAGSLVRHDVKVVHAYAPVPAILAEKGKVLQILVNLIRNAKYAADDGKRLEKAITLRLEKGAPGFVRLIVTDNGIGIPPENLTRIFQHGFTTRATGHGFGLHSSANAAKEMKGTLTVQSEGIGHGATFILELPAAPDRPQPTA